MGDGGINERRNRRTHQGALQFWRALICSGLPLLPQSQFSPPCLFLRCLNHKLPPRLPFSSFILPSLSLSLSLSLSFSLSPSDSYTSSLSSSSQSLGLLSSNCIFSSISIHHVDLLETWWKSLITGDKGENKETVAGSPSDKHTHLFLCALTLSRL